MSSKILRSINFIILSIQLLLSFGVYILHYLTIVRMGVMRHVVYQNQKWEKSLNINMITLLFGILLVILTVVAIRYGIRANRINRQTNWWILSLFTTLAIVYNQFLSKTIIRIFYYGQLIWALVIMLQLLKCLLTERVFVSTQK